MAIIGRGRLGNALATALKEAGFDVDGPLGRGADPSGVDAVLLCVPDGEIAAAAAPLSPAPLVGHCSGAAGLEPLAGHEAFSLHPLMTVTDLGASFRGAGAAIAGSTQRALKLAAQLASALGMDPIEIPDDGRAAYHAAASMASNFLVTLEAAAERLAADTGVDRNHLVPLVRATVENWAALGPGRALTGPVVRGDEATVQAQRAAITQRTPELTSLFDALVGATRTLAGGARSTAGMRTLDTVTQLREALSEPRASGQTIGLVPTMGAFHEGHLSLMRRARAECDVVVVSLFVNPAQFDDHQDLTAYPRDAQRDAAMAEQVGVDYLFVPPVEEIYPAGFATTVSVPGLSEILEGAQRGRSHFDAVATIVAKLFNIVGPDVAYFGQKDAQQALVIRRMARDLNLPVRIELCPIVREPDGLAMSSRNAHLSGPERSQALGLHQALVGLQRMVGAGERDPAAARAQALHELSGRGIEPEYLELVNPDTLAPVAQIDGHAILALIAARVGSTRLIDNQLIEPPLAAPGAEAINNRRP